MSLKVGELFAVLKLDDKDFTRNIDSAGKSATKLSGIMKLGLVAGAAGAAAGMAILGKIVHTGFVEAMDAAKGHAQLVAGIKSTGNAANVTVQGMEDLAATIQGYSGQTDDSIVATEQLLLTFTNIRNVGPDKIFDQVTMAAADMAAKMGGTASDSAIRLGRALQDPVAGMTALTRAGVVFNQSQKDAVKAMMATGDIVGAQKLILRELSVEFGGAAKAAGDSLPGMLQRLKRSFEDMAQSLAEKAIPTIQKMVPGINAFVTKVGKLIEAGDWGGVGAVVASALGTGIEAAIPVVFSSLGKALGAVLTDLSKELLNAYTGLFSGVDLLLQGKVTVHSRYVATIAALKDAVKDPWGGEIPFSSYTRGAKDAAADTGVLALAAEKLSAGLSAMYAGIGAGGTAALTLFYDKMTAFNATLAANAARAKEVFDSTMTLDGLYRSMVSPASIWENAKGSLKRYLAELDKQNEAWKTMGANLVTIAKEYGAKFGKPVMDYLATMRPDFIAKLASMGPEGASKYLQGISDYLSIHGGSIAEAVAAYCNPPLQRTAAQMGLTFGRNTAGSFTGGWGKPAVTVKVESTPAQKVAAFFKNTWTPPTVSARVTTTSAAQTRAAWVTAWGHPSVWVGVRTRNLGGGYMPAFASGGPIPGSGPVPIVAHGGEYVLTKGDMSELGKILAGSISGGDNSELVNEMRLMRVEFADQNARLIRNQRLRWA